MCRIWCRLLFRVMVRVCFCVWVVMVLMELVRWLLGFCGWLFWMLCICVVSWIVLLMVVVRIW